MSTADAILTRLPLAGVSVHSYAHTTKGQVCKILNIISRVSLLVIGSLLIVNQFPTAYLVPIAGCLVLVNIGSFSWGSNRKRTPSEIFFAVTIASVCMALVIMAGVHLSYKQTGIGLVAALGGSIVLSMPIEKGHVYEMKHHEYKSNRLLYAIDYLIGVSRDGLTSAISMVTSCFNKENYKNEVSQIMENLEGNALCVLIHGLASRPAVFDSYHSSIKALNKNITILQPHVPFNGQCTLHTASSIHNEIVYWADANPNKPIILIGHSNGARIAANINLEERANPIQVHCVAGPLNGTKFVNRQTWYQPFRSLWCSLFRKMYSDEAFTGLSYESNEVQGLMSRMKHDRYDFFFYATPSDALVFPLDSSHPNVRGHHFLALGEGHQGILSAVQDTIIGEVDRFTS